MRARGGQVADVADVQQVEDAVALHDGLAGGASRPDALGRLVEPADFPRGSRADVPRPGAEPSLAAATAPLELTDLPATTHPSRARPQGRGSGAASMEEDAPGRQTKAVLGQGLGTAGAEGRDAGVPGGAFAPKAGAPGAALSPSSLSCRWVTLSPLTSGTRLKVVLALAVANQVEGHAVGPPPSVRM